VRFSGGIGIGAGQDFLVALVLWLPGTTFAGTATESGGSTLQALHRSAAAPHSEPSTIALFLDGHAALPSWRSWRPAREPGV
jgi:prepilin-type processing-associated H-X9-DG protein